ncbi:MAG: peptide deformylase [Coprobacillus sp.]|nr:peptide deformylase [Coprobacillus sp.]
MQYKIIKDTNPRLRKKSEEVSLPLSKEDEDTLNFMLDYLIKSQDDKYATKHNVTPGVGLAAPQLGILKRMFAVYFTDENGNQHTHQLVNPKIVEQSVKEAAMKDGEGCLSVDKPHPGLVHRKYQIKLEAYDQYEKANITIDVSGYAAIVYQHEYDHLDGILFYDRIDKNNPDKKKDNEIII